MKLHSLNHNEQKENKKYIYHSLISCIWNNTFLYVSPFINEIFETNFLKPVKGCKLTQSNGGLEMNGDFELMIVIPL